MKKKGVKMKFFFCLIFGLLIGYILYSGIYNSRDHIECKKNKLKKDAKIISITTKTCGLKGGRKYRTTVIFDDGFKYISHDTHREDSLFSYKISITNEMKILIKDKAIAAHFATIGIPFYKCFDCNWTNWNLNANTCPKCGSKKVGKIRPYID